MTDKPPTRNVPPASTAGGNAPPAEPPLPLFVSAEAAVKSKRKDYVSLFDPKADLNDLKKCRSDPAIMKQAVKKLKELGFTVTSIGRCTVSISAPPECYEKHLEIKLIAKPLNTNSKNGVSTHAIVFAKVAVDGREIVNLAIPISKTSPFAELLDIVLLDLPVTVSAGTRSGDTANKRSSSKDVIYLDEVVGLLGGGQDNMPTGRGISVAVIDEDFCGDHEWFKSFNDVEKKHFGEYDDNNSHGTQVSSCLLAVAHGIKLNFICSPEWDPIAVVKTSTNFAACLKDATAKIVNCSWGHYPLREIAGSSFDPTTDNRKSSTECFLQYLKCWKEVCENHPSLVIFGSGNQGAPRGIQAFLAGLPNVIIVGGAMPAREDDSFLVDPKVNPSAVAGALGGMRYEIGEQGVVYYDDQGDVNKGDADPCPTGKPETGKKYSVTTTICGLFPPGDDDGSGTLMPGVDRSDKHDWIISFGTSYAAPEVAGVAAMVLEAWPLASPADVKQVLVATATPITKGTSAERLKLWDDTRGVHVGLVHIGRAVILARFCADVSHLTVVASAETTLKFLREKSSKFLLGNGDTVLPEDRLVINNPPNSDLLKLNYKAAYEIKTNLSHHK